MRRLLMSLLATMAILVVAPYGARADTGTPIPACDPLPPGATLRLGVANGGGTFCLLPGQRVLVTLSVDPQQFPNPANWWTPITATGDALVALPNPLLPDRGTTLARFVAVRPGAATLSSTWSVCPPAPAPACGAPIRLWRVTINVLGRG